MAKKWLWGSALARFAALMTALLLSAVLVPVLFADPAAPDPTLETPPIPEPSDGALMAGYQPEGRWGPSPGQPSLLPTKPGSPDAPATLVDFDGMNFETNFTETNFLFVPPDPTAAAGPDRVISVVNVSIEGRSKTGTLLFRDALRDFFSPLSPSTFTFDPKVIYDQYADRFVVVALERIDAGVNPSPGNISRLLLAVSKTSSPATLSSADWHYHAINAKAVIDGVEHWADYPGFAIDEEAVYVTANMFAFFGAPSVFGVRLWIIDKGLAGGFYDGGAAGVTVHDPYAEAGVGVEATTHPAHMFGDVPAGLGTFLVTYNSLTTGGPGGTEALQVIRVNDPVGTPVFSHQFVDVGDIEDVGGDFGLPPLPDAPQAGTAVKVEANDRRALHAVWRDDSLWVAATINPNSGPDAGQTTAHWWKVDTTSPDTLALSDQGNVGGEDIAPGTFTFFPSIAVNGVGEMAIGFSASAPTIFPGAYYTGRSPGDPPGTVQPSGTLRAGVDFYVRTLGGPRNRWGDYSGMAVDPSDDSTFWVFNEYALARGSQSGGEDGRWGTAYGSFRFGAVLPTLTVNKTQDTDDGSCDLADCSLREAIGAAGSGETIDFALTGTITLTSGQLLIDDDVVIEGPGCGDLSISGNDASRVFDITAGNVAISGLIGTVMPALRTAAESGTPAR